MRVAVIGGGGFRAPVVWESLAAVAERAGLEEVVLQDRDGARLVRIAQVIEGLIRERGGGVRPTTTTSLEEAVERSAFVLCAIRVGGLEGRIVDETVPLRYGVLGQETVGPGGIAFALRTVPVMLEMARLAPDAWFLPNAEDALDAATVAAALRNLPIEQREPITLRLWSGFSFDEIGELTGTYSISTRSIQIGRFFVTNIRRDGMSSTTR